MDPTSYIEPSLESFYDYLIREKDKLMHLGMISNADTSGKYLLEQPKENSNPTNKQNRCNSKSNKGSKPS